MVHQARAASAAKMMRATRRRPFPAGSKFIAVPPEAQVKSLRGNDTTEKVVHRGGFEPP